MCRLEHTAAGRTPTGREDVSSEGRQDASSEGPVHGKVNAHLPDGSNIPSVVAERRQSDEGRHGYGPR